LLLPTSTWAFTHTEQSSPKITFAAWINYATINNSFMQIPMGGTSDTTLANRPTFNELGITNTTNYNLSIQANWEVWGLYGMYNYNRPQGQTILTKPLFTHALTFPAGTLVTASTAFDLYRLGLTYNLSSSDKWQFYPLVEGTLLVFDYQLKSNTAFTQRNFNQATVRFGIGGKYYFTPKFMWDFELATSIPRMINLNVQTANTHLGYTILATPSQTTSIFAGIAYTHIDFKDRQTTPNHIRLIEWPSSEIGLRVTLL